MEMMANVKECKRIIELMKATEKNKDVLMRGYNVLSMLSKEKGLRKTILSSGGLAVVVRIMNTFKEDVEMQQCGCMVLAQIARHENVKCEITVTTEDVCPIIEAMKKFKENAKMQAAACHVLGTFAYINDENGATIFDSNGIDLILRAIKRFHNDANVVQKCCYAFATLAYNDENREIIGSSHGVQLVVRAMEVFEGNAEVLKWGCCAIANFVHNDNNSKIIESLNGTRLVVRAMKTFEDDAELQKWACCALGNLSVDNNKNSEIIGSSNGVQLVVRAMETFKNDVGVQQWGCWAFRALASNAQNSEIIGSLNGIQLVVRAMEAFEDDAELQDNGCLALRYLAGDDENREIIAETSGLARICEAIHRQRELAGVDKGYSNVEASGTLAIMNIMYGNTVTELRLGLTFAFPSMISLSGVDRTSTDELVRFVCERHDKHISSEWQIARSLWYICFMLKCTQTGLYNAFGGRILARIFRFQFRGARRPFPILHADAFRARAHEVGIYRDVAENKNWDPFFFYMKHAGDAFAVCLSKWKDPQSGWTLLHHAACDDRRDAADLVLHHAPFAADVKNKDGKLPYQLATRDSTLATRLWQVLDVGAAVFDALDTKCAALYEKVKRKKNNWRSVIAALEVRNDLSVCLVRWAESSSGWTLLHKAAYHGNRKVVDALVKSDRYGHCFYVKTNGGKLPYEFAQKGYRRDKYILGVLDTRKRT